MGNSENYYRILEIGCEDICTSTKVVNDEKWRWMQLGKVLEYWSAPWWLQKTAKSWRNCQFWNEPHKEWNVFMLHQDEGGIGKVRKKWKPTNPVPAFFPWQNSEKYSKFWNFFQRFKIVNKFGQVPKYLEKYWEKFGTILVRPKKGGEKVLT